MAGMIFLLNVFTASCHKSPLMSDDNMNGTETDTIRIKTAVSLGSVNSTALNEVSGIVTSAQDNTSIWVHNDSGDRPSIYLLDDKATLKYKCTIANANNRDWEDISIYKGKLYIGDIGDNLGIHPYCTIYLIDEPSIKSANDVTVNPTDRIIYKYPDGARDAETLMTDPLNGDIYIVSKRETNVNVYRIKYPYPTKDTTIAEKVMTLPFSYIVGGDISRDGKEMLMKTYQKIYYWQRKSGKTISETLAQKPQELPYQQEPQGESICWSTDGKSFFTLSEESPLKVKPVLYRFDKQ
jgi:hypothetical protein